VDGGLSGASSLTVIDGHPNDHGYVVVGFGDMGDRMLGTK
jgi:uracil phosphoribosyltransferase